MKDKWFEAMQRRRFQNQIVRRLKEYLNGENDPDNLPKRLEEDMKRYGVDFTVGTGTPSIRITVDGEPIS